MSLISNQENRIPPYDYDLTEVMWSRQSVAGDKKKMYLYSENAMYTSGNNPIHLEDMEEVNPFLVSKLVSSKYPNQTQACIRGLTNAFPIITKPNYYRDHFYDVTKEDWESFNRNIDFNISVIIEESVNYDSIIIPSDGFATGKSRLPKAFAELLADKLNLLIKKTSLSGIHYQFKPVLNRYIPDAKNKNYKNNKWYSVIID